MSSVLGVTAGDQQNDNGGGGGGSLRKCSVFRCLNGIHLLKIPALLSSREPVPVNFLSNLFRSSIVSGRF